MKKGHIINKRDQCYLGCEASRGFFLRFQAQCELRGIDKRVLLLTALEIEMVKWENKVDQRLGTAYDALLEAKARQNGMSVNEIKAELIINNGKNGTGKYTKRNSPTWPKIKR
jgi:hypothetical protein